MKYFLYLTLFFSIYSPANAVIELEEGSTYTAVAKAPSGDPLYFHMVKVTRNNYDFWKTYYENVTPIAGCGRGLMSSLYNLPSAKKSLDNKAYNKLEITLRSAIGLRSEEFDDLMKKTEAFDKDIDERYKNCAIDIWFAKHASSQFKNLDVGITGARHTFNMFASSDELDNTPHVFIAFASTAPLKDIDQSKSPPRNISGTTDNLEKQFKEFQEAYGKIVMSLNVIHNPKAPTSTHFGIFRNPLDIHESFLTGKNPHRDIAMLLHGFAATVEQTYFHEKIYMNTWPTVSMTTIFTNVLGEDAIEPISNLYRLVENLNEQWNFSQTTLSGKPTAIKLQALVPLFAKAEIKDTKDEVKE